MTKRIVILGGGFGGIYAARRLERTLAKRTDVEVVLITRENYLLFTPMLHEVAAAKNIEAAVDGARKRPFRFSTLGQFATLGRHDGVAQVLGIRISGFVAWWLWRMIYLGKLPGIVKKLRVATNWSLDLLFAREIEQFVTVRDVERMEALSAVLRTLRESRA